MSMNCIIILLCKLGVLVGQSATKVKPLILKFQIVQKEMSSYIERSTKEREQERNFKQMSCKGIYPTTFWDSWWSHKLLEFRGCPKLIGTKYTTALQIFASPAEIGWFPLSAFLFAHLSFLSFNLYFKFLIVSFSSRLWPGLSIFQED